MQYNQQVGIIFLKLQYNYLQLPNKQQSELKYNYLTKSKSELQFYWMVSIFSKENTQDFYMRGYLKEHVPANKPGKHYK